MVFDLDGVLVDSEPLHCRAIREAVQTLEVSFSDEEYTLELMGLDDRTLIARAFALRGRSVEPAVAAELARLKTERLARLARDGVAGCPGAVALLRSAAATLPVGLCSGSRRVEIDLLLDALGPDVRGQFRAIVSSDDVSASKPDPEGYRRAAGALGLDPASCLAIEDTASGVAAARAAGLRVVAVDALGTPERLAAADRVVPDLTGVGVDTLRSWF